MSAVRAELLTCDGAALPLPPLRSWDVARTDGESCDAYTLTCALPPQGAEALRRANRLRAYLNGTRLLTGTVDELELSLGESGTEATVCGRGLGGLLLDNQADACTFRYAPLDEIVRRYVTPYGVAAQAAAQVCVERFAVECGNSCLQVLKGFCAHAGLMDPMFDANGTLLLRQTRPEAGVTFHQSGLLAAVYRDRRYGVISRQTLRHQRTQAVQTAQNELFIARGGRCERYGLWSGQSLPATWRSAAQRVAVSSEDACTLELTVPSQWPCEPGTVAQVELPVYGVVGRFCVRQVRTLGDSRGCRAVVSLFREEA